MMEKLQPNEIAIYLIIYVAGIISGILLNNIVTILLWSFLK